MNRGIPRLVGMIHLAPLPGSPRFGGAMSEVLSTAAGDAQVLVDAGFPALIVENLGDAPFHADRVPAETVAAMTLAVREVAAAGVPVGVNVLRNDALAALGIAAVTGAAFIRVNVLTGMMYTDQGPIVGRAAEVARARAALAPDVEVWADVMVKHATPPPGTSAAHAAIDTVERGLADAVIVSGSGTSVEPDVDQAREIAEAVPAGTRVVIGSGSTPENIDRLLAVADTVIVGSAIEVEGKAGNRADPLRAKVFVERAAERGLV